ncbi:MAG: YcgN family cysteine cluster protein [Bradymonadaceae bacterium]|nr:YcgN family cysteine cluster protein [Lujinxingiaceae bacterium]
MEDQRPFWERKTLEQMTRAEWESLCDGCGRCCLRKFEYEDTAEVVESRIACRLFDIATCRCSNYSNRLAHVSDCIVLSPEKVVTMDFLPASCAYRRLANDQGLAWWHPLVSGDAQTVHTAGISVQGRGVISEDDVSAWELEELDDRYLLVWSKRGQ